MRIAKAIFGLIGTAILGLLVTYIMIPDWTMTNLRDYFWQTVGGFLISAVFGGALVFIAYATYITWRLGDKPVKAFKSLKRVASLEGCESLDSMVEPIKELDEASRQIDEKDQEIDFLKKQIEAADNAKELKNQEPDGIEILRGDDALNLIRMLTDNQKSALAYFYGEGGSAEADSMDAELIELSRLGLLLQPQYFAPGMTAKWIVPPNVNKILDDHPDLLEGFLGPLPVSIETLQELPPSIARHIVEMAENGKDVPFQKITMQENESLLNGDGIFERPKMVFAGSARDAEFYRLTKEWRLFLSDEENLNKAKIVAGMK